MTAYYNEIDPFAAEWLENLILIGAIAPGVVDRRSIEDVAPSDLKDFTQCHFFAGIGVWSHALRAAGWPDDRPVWTGSCPCQPFSQAGQGGGLEDDRHLWPALHHLAVICEPRVLFGEQVSSKDGLAWLDLVHTDMEATGYAFGALDLCAAGVGAPHIRQRTFWMAHAGSAGFAELGGRRNEPQGLAENGSSRVVGVAHDARLSEQRRERRIPYEAGRTPARKSTERADTPAGELADADGRECDGLPGGEGCERNGQTTGRFESDGSAKPGRTTSELADAGSEGRRQVPGSAPSDENTHGRAGRDGVESDGDNEPSSHGENDRPSPTNGFWGNADWLACRDGKWRPVEPGTFPLANGVANRVGSLRGYGNAIIGPLAKEFIEIGAEYLGY